MKNQKTTNSKLPPLDLKEEEKFEALSEKKEVKFVKCPHKDVKFLNDKLICKCGAVWSGSRLQELFDLLTKKK